MRGAAPAAWGLMISGVFAVSWIGLAGPRAAVLTEPGARAPERASESSRRSRDSLSAVVIGRDLFRADRRPAAVTYDAQRAVNPTPVVTPPPKPALRLLGLIEGRDATVVIEGIPGIEGSRVARVGDVIGGLTVRSITGGEVRIAGLDTVWVLKVRTTWP